MATETEPNQSDFEEEVIHEICYTKEQKTIRHLVDLMDNKVLHLPIELYETE